MEKRPNPANPNQESPSDKLQRLFREVPDDASLGAAAHDMAWENKLPDNYAFYLANCPKEWKNLPPAMMARRVQAKLRAENAIKGSGVDLDTWNSASRLLTQWMLSASEDEILERFRRNRDKFPHMTMGLNDAEIDELLREAIRKMKAGKLDPDDFSYADYDRR